MPIKIFILNNQYMGMVRQWQQLLHGNRLSHTYSEALPDFVKLADAFGCVGLQAIKPGDLDGAIKEMISVSVRAVRLPGGGAGELFPDDPSGKAHNEMLLPAEANDEATPPPSPAARRWCEREPSRCLTSGNWKRAQDIVGAAMPPTPAHAWPLLSERLGATVIVKHENHTPIGAFKCARARLC